MIGNTKRFLIVSFAIIISLIQSSVTQAITLQEFYSDQDIIWYDKEAKAYVCTPATGDTTTPVVAATGQNEQTVYQYSIGKGLTPEQSAGIVGNLMWESGGINPRSNEVGGTAAGRGIAQWGVNGRWVALVQFAIDGGRSEWDLIVQLDFMWQELQTNRKGAYTALVATTTIKDATDSFMNLYEQPNKAKENEPARLKYAEEAFQKYSGLAGIGGSASNGGCGGSTISGGTIVQIAEAEYAKNIVEIPPQCDAGNPYPPVKGTCGPEIDKYTDGYLQYWCADFVSWVYKTAGTPFSGGDSGGWRQAGVNSVKDWFVNNGIFFGKNDPTYTPQPGDVVIYSYSHTDIVVAVTGTSMVTIGGNTGVGDAQNGNGVGKKTKDINSPTIVGFGRLK